MSERFEFQISKKQLIINSVIVLLGILVASIFLRFTSEKLLLHFGEQLENYFDFANFWQVIVLLFQECFWILLIISLSVFPYGKLFASIIIFYKGFSIGVVSSVFCRQFGVHALKYIGLLILPQNLLYIFSLCIAAQISAEIALNTVLRGQHGRVIITSKKAYIFSFIITAVAAVVESLGIPMIYNIFF